MRISLKIFAACSHLEELESHDAGETQMVRAVGARNNVYGSSSTFDGQDVTVLSSTSRTS